MNSLLAFNPAKTGAEDERIRRMQKPLVILVISNVLFFVLPAHAQNDSTDRSNIIPANQTVQVCRCYGTSSPDRNQAQYADYWYDISAMTTKDGGLASILNYGDTSSSNYYDWPSSQNVRCPIGYVAYGINLASSNSGNYFHARGTWLCAPVKDDASNCRWYPSGNPC